MRTKDYIEKGESDGKSLIDAMEQGDLEGMQTFDGVIEQLIRDGHVTIESALPYSTNSNNLMLRLADLGGKSPAAKAPDPPKRDESSMLDMIER